MKIQHIICVVGTRPEAIKMAPVIMALRQRPDQFHCTVLATGQHREMLKQTLRAFRLKADVDLNIMTQGQSLKDITVNALSGLYDYLREHPCDTVIAQGDTTTVMTAAMACFYLQIPFTHLEAGLRTGDMYAPYPEEYNRRIAALSATCHLAPTQKAGQQLRDEHIPDSSIYVTGNTVIDALLFITRQSGKKITSLPSRTVLITCHRREIFGAPMEEVFQAVAELAALYPAADFIYPVHPNPEVKEPAHRLLGSISNVRLIEPMDYPDFCRAMHQSHIILTDSGGVQEEAPALGKPVVVLRDVTERPEGVAAGTCILAGPHKDRIIHEVRRLMDNRDEYEKVAGTQNPYGDGHASERIVHILSGEPFEPWSQ